MLHKSSLQNVKCFLVRLVSSLFFICYASWWIGECTVPKSGKEKWRVTPNHTYFLIWDFQHFLVISSFTNASILSLMGCKPLILNLHLRFTNPGWAKIHVVRLSLTLYVCAHFRNSSKTGRLSFSGTVVMGVYPANGQ